MTLEEVKGAMVVLCEALKTSSTEDIRSMIRVHLRLATLDAILAHLREAMNGDELLLKEVFEACAGPDDRSAVYSEVKSIMDTITPGKLPSNLFIFSVIGAAHEELEGRGEAGR